MTPCHSIFSNDLFFLSEPGIGRYQVAADDRIIDQLFDRFQKVGRPVDQPEMSPRSGPQEGAEGRRGSRNQPVVFPLEQRDESCVGLSRSWDTNPSWYSPATEK